MCVPRMEEGADMHSLLMTDNNSLLMGGLQNYVVEVDLNTVQETQKVRHATFTAICACSTGQGDIKYPKIT